MNNHIGVNLSDFAQIEAFYPEALTRKPEDWGAFVLNPNGHNLEAVRHGPDRA